MDEKENPSTSLAGTIERHLLARIAECTKPEALTKDHVNALSEVSQWVSAYETFKRACEYGNQVTSDILLGPTHAVKQAIVVDAFLILKAAMQQDPEYAWSWQCNLAMAIFDEDKEEILSPDDAARSWFANHAAARLMKFCFDVDITKSPQWVSLTIARFLRNPPTV